MERGLCDAGVVCGWGALSTGRGYGSGASGDGGGGDRRGGVIGPSLTLRFALSLSLAGEGGGRNRAAYALCANG